MAVGASAAGDEGVVTTYDVDVHYETAIGGGGGELTLALTGRLAVARLPGKPARERWDASGLSAVARRGSAVEPAGFRGLGAPLVVELDESGAPARLGFTPDADVSARQLLEYLVSELRPGRAPAGRAMWVAKARDATGDYTADWRREGPRALRMVKRAYLPATGRPDVTISESAHRFGLSAGGEIDSVAAREALRIAGVDTQTTGTVSVKLVGRASGRVAGPAADVVWFAFGTANAASQGERDAALIGHTTRDQALADLEKPSLGGRELYGVFAAVGAFARRDPTTVAILERRADAPGAPLQRLAVALFVADTEAADSVLARWLDQGGARAGAVSEQLLFTRPPSPALVAALIARASKPSLTDGGLWQRSTLALGGAAHALGPVRPAEAKDLVERLLALEERSAGDTRGVVLAALGNTRSPAVLERVHQRLIADDARAAAGAAYALGSIDTASATTLLDQTATRDRRAEIRIGALHACASRDRSLRCASPPRLATKDPDRNVRRAALEATAADPGVRRALLVELSAHDPDAELRAYATKQLAAPPGGAR